MLLNEAKDTVGTELARCCDSHAVSIHCLEVITPVDSLGDCSSWVRVATSAGATRHVAANPQVTNLQIQREGDVSCRAGRGCPAVSEGYLETVH